MPSGSPAKSLCRRKAAPLLSILMRIGKPRHREEEPSSSPFFPGDSEEEEKVCERNLTGLPMAVAAAVHGHRQRKGTTSASLDGGAPTARVDALTDKRHRGHCCFSSWPWPSSCPRFSGRAAPRGRQLLGGAGCGSFRRHRQSERSGAAGCCRRQPSPTAAKERGARAWSHTCRHKAKTWRVTGANGLGVLDTPQPIKPADPVRDDKDDDDAWDKKKRDHAPVEMSYTLENKKWQTANKKCMAFTKNTIENAIVGSIAECASVGEYLEKIKSQFTGSSKTYATQLLKQLVTEKYSGGAHGIREHILRMSNLAAKLKPMDADLELKPALLVHLVMASLPHSLTTLLSTTK
ncbi:hypothetical protein QYE76_020532 [Lolium multiflorum]|uniref:Uncharacterized protein n=1 Tax=Lolium multiflorum TaxID=4521 RepID=A0AAD8R500_LOLMU|nr:hypothetical protein QYE76_020532 [Lolium multiflorum]